MAEHTSGGMKYVSSSLEDYTIRAVGHGIGSQQSEYGELRKPLFGSTATTVAATRD